MSKEYNLNGKYLAELSNFIDFVNNTELFDNYVKKAARTKAKAEIINYVFNNENEDYIVKSSFSLFSDELSEVLGNRAAYSNEKLQKWVDIGSFIKEPSDDLLELIEPYENDPYGDEKVKSMNIEPSHRVAHFKLFKGVLERGIGHKAPYLEYIEEYYMYAILKGVEIKLHK